MKIELDGRDTSENIGQVSWASRRNSAHLKLPDLMCDPCGGSHTPAQCAQPARGSPSRMKMKVRTLEILQLPTLELRNNERLYELRTPLTGALSKKL